MLSLVNEELLCLLLKICNLKAQQRNLRIEILKACSNNKKLAIMTFKSYVNNENTSLLFDKKLEIYKRIIDIGI